MNKFTLFLSVSILFVTIDACQRTSRKELSIDRSKNGTEVLKTNGFYFTNYVDTRGDTNTLFFVLFDNGVIYGPSALDGGHKGGVGAEVNDYLKEPYYPLSRRPPYFWGIYNVTDRIITLEKWYSTDGGPYPTRIDQGYILDKETIYFPNSRLDTMRFMPLKEKPDSTNPFVPYEEVQKRKKAIRYEHN